MFNIALRDILINAKQESFRMYHYYLGVEHLFIGLLEIQGGLTRSLIEAQGLTADYVIDAIRRQTGKGSQQRLWAGIQHTPRANIVMSIGNDLALEDGRQEMNERDLLIAILEENDSIPIRVMRKLGVDLEMLARESRTFVPDYTNSHPYVQIDYSPDFPVSPALNENQLFILRRMFDEYSQIRVERRLTGGYTQALIALVTPKQGDGSEDAPVVVKIDSADLILDEAMRYDQYVKTSLPPLTARLEEKPTTAESTDLAGLKYTFVAGVNRTEQNLRLGARDLGIQRVGRWLQEELYPYFGRTWWQARKPYRFQVWQEYDWLLPPILTLEYAGEEPSSSIQHVLRDPIRRRKLTELEYGDLVAVENFSVQRVYPEKDMIQIAIGKGSEAAKRAYKINVKNINLAQNAYYRGETLERIMGRVWKNREELLQHAAGEIFPTFDTRADHIPGIPEVEKLPNPLLAYEDLLELHVNGSLSKIHGDLHLGNILVGPNESAFLIDFAQTRDGHALFDWATLEISLINDLIVPVAGQEWTNAAQIARCVYAINRGAALPNVPPELAESFAPLQAVRDIVNECLAKQDKWAEYFVALTMCSLRAVTWDTMSIGGRRAMLLIAGLALHELRARPTRSTPGARTPSYFEDSNDTDITS